MPAIEISAMPKVAGMARSYVPAGMTIGNNVISFR